MRQKKLIILDLDNTVICARSGDKVQHKGAIGLPTHSLEFDDMSYEIYHRPYLEGFLEFIFTHFYVAVWTAAGEAYAKFIVDNIILAGKDRELVFFYDQRKEKYSQQYDLKNPIIKNLQIVRDKFPEFKDIVILDDNLEVCSQDNSFNIPPFDIDEYHDCIEKGIPIPVDDTLLKIEVILRTTSPDLILCDELVRNFYHRRLLIPEGIRVIYTKLLKQEKINLPSLIREYHLAPYMLDTIIHGRPLITHAIIVHNYELVRDLLRHGSDVNYPDLFKRYPLHYAIHTENPDLCTLLVNAGADPNTIYLEDIFPKDEIIAIALKIGINLTGIYEIWKQNIQKGVIYLYSEETLRDLKRKFNLT